MSMQPVPVSVVQFGPFEFDTASGELRKHRIRVRLQGQPLQILSTLLNNPGRVVGRDELQRILWPGAVSGDFEHGLNAAVNKLRQVLSDSADQPRYIETLPGRGYRWIAPAHTPPRPVLEMPLPASVPPKRSPVRPDFRWIALGALVFVAIVTGLVFPVLHLRAVKSPPGRPLRFSVTPPPGWFLQGAGARQSFALSPDGTKLAFTAMDNSGAFRVFLRDFESLEPQMVPDSTGAGTVFWHPDGGSLFFTSRGLLRRLPEGAGATQVVTEAMPGLFSAMWPSADRMVLSSRFTSASVPASGGSSVPEKQVYTWPQILPDGRHVLHVEFDRRIGRYRGRVTDLKEVGKSRDLVETDSKVVYAAPGHLLYVRAGTLVAQPFDPSSARIKGAPVPLASTVCTFLPAASADFSVSGTGVLVYQPCVSRSQLMWVNRTGERVSQASPPGLAVKAARLSPDGRRLATSVYDFERGVSDVWLFDRDGSAGRKIVGPGLSHSPVWSTDGRHVVLARTVETTPKLFLRSLEGQENEEPLPHSEFQMPTDWSPDGRFVVYNNTGTPLTQNEQHGDIWAVDLQHSRRLVPLVVTRHHEANAAFSPDGGWVAFTSTESGRPEVYVQRLQRGDSMEVTGLRHVVSRHGAQALRWRADGRELFYLGGDGTIYAVPLRLEATPTIGSPSALFQVSAEARAAVHAVLGFDVSADGKQFVIPVVSSDEKPSLVVIHNWTSLLPDAHR